MNIIISIIILAILAILSNLFIKHLHKQSDKFRPIYELLEKFDNYDHRQLEYNRNQLKKEIGE